MDTIRRIALECKMTGTDIHHIGDSGYVGMALPENITAYSVAIRGIRHTYRRMACPWAENPARDNLPPLPTLRERFFFAPGRKVWYTEVKKWEVRFMGLWLYMLAVDLLIPLVMVIFGAIFTRRPPKNINGFYGYRTRRSWKVPRRGAMPTRSSGRPGCAGAQFCSWPP